jgi:hypothetical protein
MPRQSQVVFMGLALAAVAACSESVSSRIAAPTDASASNNPYTGPGAGQNKVTICHAAGRLGTTHYVEITVGAPAQYAHINEHGNPQAGHEEDYYTTKGSDCGAASPGPTLTKTLVDVMKAGPTVGSMVHDDAWVPGMPLVIPVDQTRWLFYQLSYTLPAGMTGTISENSVTVCGSLGTFRIQCSFNESPVTAPVYSWPAVSGAGSVTVQIDLGGGGAGMCGDRLFTNTAVLTPSSGPPVTATFTSPIRVVAGTKWGCSP